MKLQWRGTGGLLALALLLLTVPCRAQQTGGQVPVRVIDGRLVVSCDVSGPRRRIPVNLFVEYEGAFGLQLHNRAAASLPAESQDGEAFPLTLHFPGFEVEVERRELGDEELLEDFTKYHSVALGENAIVGSIGAEVLTRFAVTFDLGRGMMQLLPPASGTEPPPSGVTVAQDGSITLPLTESSGLAWVPVRLADGTPRALALGCAHYDTRIESAEAELLGAPGGDLGPVRLGGIDLAEYVAFRPEELVLVHPDGALGTLGVNLLESFVVEIDRQARTARFQPMQPPEFPVADRAFFQARASGELEELRAFLTDHGDARLAHEASELLLNGCLEQGEGDAELREAVEWMHTTTAEDLRTTRMLDLMVEMADAGEPDVVLAAGELGVETGRDDRYPNAVHKVHGRMGRVLLDREDLDGSWRHLLSAAFGLPTDGRINLDLGRCYEAQGRIRRAYSRYVQAVIVPETGSEALNALERIQPLMEDAEPFSVDVIERMIAGKVRNFGSASFFQPTNEQPAGRVVLTEFFTNAHQGDDRGGAIGGALGNEGLLDHFDPEYAAFLTWHLPEPALSPLCSEAALIRAEQLGVEEAGLHVVDGVAAAPGVARPRQAEALYNRVRETMLKRLAEESDYYLELDASIEGDRLTGHLLIEDLSGPPGAELRVRVALAERGVLFPGKSTVVVHRMVGRALLLEPNGQGVPFAPDEYGAQELEFTANLSEIEQGLRTFLDQRVAEGGGVIPDLGTRIDPGQVVLVAFLSEAGSPEVLSAVSAEPDLPKETP